MTSYIRIVATLVFAAAALSVNAADAADLKVGVVSVPRLLDEAPQAKAAMENLQQEFEPRQREIASKQDEVRGAQEQLQKERDLLSEEDLRRSESDLRQKQRDLMRRQNEVYEEFNVRRTEELGKLHKVLLEEVQVFAKGQNYDLIVGDGILYASTAMDVTDAILDGLRASYGDDN